MKKIILMLILTGAFSSFTFAKALSGEELQQKGIEGIERYIQYSRENNQNDTAIINQAFNDLTGSTVVFEKEKKFNEKTLSLIKIGDIYRISNNFEEAYQFYEKALKLAKRQKNNEGIARALLGKAKVEMYFFKKYGSAENNIDDALVLIKKIKIPKLLIEALDFKSQVQIYQNKILEASITLDTALKKAEVVKDKTLLYFIYFGLGDVNLQLAKTCDYEFYFDICKENILKSKKNYEKAIKIAKQNRWLGNTTILKSILNGVKEYENLIINPRERQTTSLDDLNLFHPKTKDDIKFTKDFIYVDTNQTNFWSLMEKTLPLWMDANPNAPLLDKLLAENYKEIMNLKKSKDAQTTFLQGMYLESKGKNNEALEKFLLALNQMEAQQLNLMNNQIFNQFTKDKMVMYYSPILHLLQKGDNEKAFSVFERSRSFTLRTLLENKKISLNNKNEKENLIKKMNLYSKISSVQSDYDLKKDKDNLKKLMNLESEYRDFLEKIKKETPKLNQLIAPSSGDIKILQKELKKEETEILQYLVQAQQLIIWHITPDKVDVKSVWLPQNELIKKVDLIYDELKEEGTTKNNFFDSVTSKELFLYTIQPMLDNIKSKRLVIVPHYELNQLPFQVLINPETNQSLGETFQISYAPSASIWMGLKSIKNLKDRNLLAIGEPKMTKGLEEIDYISSLYPNNHTKIIKDKLTKEEFYKNIKGHNIVHLSLHGEYSARAPMLSHIKLPPKNQKMGHVTASEMFGLPLEENSLVVLSACETGRVKTTQSNETLGIVRGLLYAGADAVLLSSWKVDEEATALWMKTFYKVAQTENLAEASRQAMIKVKSVPKFNHPRYWSGFSLIMK